MEDLIQVKPEAQIKALLQDPENTVLSKINICYNNRHLLFTVSHVQITALSLDLKSCFVFLWTELCEHWKKSFL